MLRISDPERLWRRLCVCAFEDFGLVDLGVTAQVTAVAASKTFRMVLGEGRVVRYLIGLLCACPKDRRLDDLAALGSMVFADPAYLRLLEDGELGGVIAPLVHEAARLLGSCERPVPRRSFRSIVPEACERILAAMERDGRIDAGMLELCVKAVRVSRCILPMLLPIAIEATDEAGGRGEAQEQELDPVPLIDGVPAYAFDGFTRSGRAVLAQLGKEEPELRTLLAPLPAGARIDVLHHLLFFAEGGRCNSLLKDPLADELTLAAYACGARLSQDEALGAIGLMRRALPAVHRLRAVLAPSVTHLLKEELS